MNCLFSTVIELENLDEPLCADSPLPTIETEMDADDMTKKDTNSDADDNTEKHTDMDIANETDKKTDKQSAHSKRITKKKQVSKTYMDDKGFLGRKFNFVKRSIVIVIFIIIILFFLAPTSTKPIIIIIFIIIKDNLYSTIM